MTEPNPQPLSERRGPVMGYCIDDICHNSEPMCGAGSPYHCRADGGPPADHYCDDPGCETCEPWGEDPDFDDPDGWEDQP